MAISLSGLIGCMSAQPDFKNLSRSHQQLIEKNIESRLQQINTQTPRDMYRRSFSVANHPSLQRSHSFDANSNGPDSGTSAPTSSRGHQPRHSGGTLQKVGQMFVKMSPSLVRKKKRGKNLARAVRSEMEKNQSFMMRDPKVYGVALKRLLQKQKLSYPDLKVPRILVMLRKAFRPHLKREGIFRAAGEANEITVLRRFIDSGVSQDELKLDTFSPFTLADCFKMYFKLMPAPLFPFKMYDAIMTQVKKPDFRPKDLISVLSGLPKENRAVLEFLIETMIEVASVPENRMDVASLAICFSPNILRPLEVTPEVILADSKLLHVCLLTLANYHLSTVYGVSGAEGQVPHALFAQIVARAQKIEAIQKLPPRSFTLPSQSSSQLDDIDSGDTSDALSVTMSDNDLSTPPACSHSGQRSRSPSVSASSASSSRKRFGKLKKSNTLNRTVLRASADAQKPRKSGKRWIQPRKAKTATSPIQPAVIAGFGSSRSLHHKRTGSNQLPMMPPSPAQLRAHRKTLSAVGDPRDVLSASQRAKNLVPVSTAPLRSRSPPGAAGKSRSERNITSPPLASPCANSLSRGRSRGLTLTAVQENADDDGGSPYHGADPHIPSGPASDSRVRSITRTSTNLPSVRLVTGATAAGTEHDQRSMSIAQSPANRVKLVSHTSASQLSAGSPLSASSSHQLHAHGRTSPVATRPSLKLRLPAQGNAPTLVGVIAPQIPHSHARGNSLKSPPITASNIAVPFFSPDSSTPIPTAGFGSDGVTSTGVHQHRHHHHHPHSCSQSHSQSNNSNNSSAPLLVARSTSPRFLKCNNDHPERQQAVGSSAQHTPSNRTPSALSPVASPRSGAFSPRSSRRERQRRTKSMFAAPVFFDSDDESDSEDPNPVATAAEHRARCRMIEAHEQQQQQSPASNPGTLISLTSPTSSNGSVSRSATSVWSTDSHTSHDLRMDSLKAKISPPISRKSSRDRGQISHDLALERSFHHAHHQQQHERPRSRDGSRCSSCSRPGSRGSSRSTTPALPNSLPSSPRSGAASRHLSRKNSTAGDGGDQPSDHSSDRHPSDRAGRRSDLIAGFEKLLTHQLGSGCHSSSPRAVAGGSTRIFEVRRSHKHSSGAAANGARPKQPGKRRSASLPNVFLLDYDDFQDEYDWTESEAEDCISSLEK